MNDNSFISHIQQFWAHLKEIYMGIVSGKVVHNFFRNNGTAIVYLFFLGVLYLMMVYTCGDQRSQISRLQKEVKVAYYRHMAAETRLTEMTRQSTLEKTLIERKLSIHESDHPAIIIK